MTRDIRLRVRQCEVCQASKHRRPTETTGRHRLYASRPWQVVAVDLVGPLPLSAKGNTWIRVLTDHFTRWADALAIPDATTPHGGPGPGLKCILLPRVTGADTYGPGCPVPVPAHGRPLPDIGGEPESDHPISPARERSRRAGQQDVR